MGVCQKQLPNPGLHAILSGHHKRLQGFPLSLRDSVGIILRNSHIKAALAAATSSSWRFSAGPGCVLVDACWTLAGKGGFPKLGVSPMGVPITRLIVHWSVNWGPPFWETAKSRLADVGSR